MPTPSKLPRGIRNHNPGNIKRSGDRWQGMSNSQADPIFIVFETPEFGIRALARVLLTYFNRYDLKSVAGIIHRWAPPMENDTPGYIRSVARRLEVEPDDVLDLHDYTVMQKLVVAIIAHENANYRYAGPIVARGVELALGSAMVKNAVTAA